MVLGGEAVSWRCRRQKQKSDSSHAAEFRATKSVAKEVVWLRYLLEFLECKQDAVTIAYDNKECSSSYEGSGSTRQKLGSLLRSSFTP